MPGGHIIELANPSVGQNDPIGQVMQLVDANLSLYLPFKQELQLTALKDSEYVPIGHGKHEDAENPLGMYSPGLQLKHVL